MTEKIHTDKCERWNLTERLHRQTLTLEHDRNMDEYDRKCFISVIYTLRGWSS